MTPINEFRRLFANRDFRLLWLSQSASVIGDNIVLVAIALFVIQRTGSATDLGLIFGAQALALVSFLLIGGVWADRIPRHRVMISTDLARFALHALLAVLIFTGEVRVWQIVVIEMLFGTGEAFFRPAAAGLLPQTVAEADIQPATAATTMSRNVAEFAGPALATALVLGAGAGWAFALDSATFLVSAALLAGVRGRRREVSEHVAPARETTLWNDIRAGFREVRARAWVWCTLLAFCVALFCCLAPLFVLGPIIAREQYGEIGVYGVVTAALGLGTIIGSLAGLAWRPRYPIRWAMLMIMLWPAATILYAAGATLVLVIPATVIAGAGIALFDVWWLTALAERFPADMLSRVTSYDWMVSLALLPLGYVLAGPLAAQLGSVNLLLGGSVLATIALAAALLPRETRMLERLAADTPPAVSDDQLSRLIRPS